MTTTNLITFEISFQNSTETFIFNVSNDSINSLLKVLKPQKIQVSKVKEFDRTQSKFKTVSKKRFLQCIDHNTELFELLK